VVTAGDLVRAEIKKGAASERSQALRRIVEAGGLVPDEIMLPLVAEGLPSGTDTSDSDGGYILDGFPRTATQARMLDAMLAARGLGPIQRAVNIVLADWVRTYVRAPLSPRSSF
jgi:adenylate kinase